MWANSEGERKTNKLAITQVIEMKWVLLIIYSYISRFHIGLCHIMTIPLTFLVISAYLPPPPLCHSCGMHVVCTVVKRKLKSKTVSIITASFTSYHFVVFSSSMTGV